MHTHTLAHSFTHNIDGRRTLMHALAKQTTISYYRWNRDSVHVHDEHFIKISFGHINISNGDYRRWFYTHTHTYHQANCNYLQLPHIHLMKARNYCAPWLSFEYLYIYEVRYQNNNNNNKNSNSNYTLLPSALGCTSHKHTTPLNSFSLLLFLSSPLVFFGLAFRSQPIYSHNVNSWYSDSCF